MWECSAAAERRCGHDTERLGGKDTTVIVPFRAPKGTSAGRPMSAHCGWDRVTCQLSGADDLICSTHLVTNYRKLSEESRHVARSRVE